MEQVTGRIDKAPLMALVDGIVIHIGELEINPETGKFVGVNITHVRRAKSVSVRINKPTGIAILPCDLSSRVVEAAEDGHPTYITWCDTHKLQATHARLDGGSLVCTIFAENVGCDCCRGSYPKDRS